MKIPILIAQVGLIGVWAWAIAGSLGLAVPGAALCARVAIGLLVVHTLELAMFLPRLASAEGSRPRHVVGIMVFGVLYYLGARSEAQQPTTK